MPISCPHTDRFRAALRAATAGDVGDYWFPDIRSLPGAALMLVLVLYPYVYLLARARFLSESATALEAARTLGRGPWRSFFSVSLPLARPALAAGAALALMEAFADYGTVSYFGVPVFSTGIYSAWFSFGDPAAAAQLAAMLIGFVALALAVERAGPRRRALPRGRDAATRGRPAHPSAGGCARSAPWWRARCRRIFGFVVPAAVLADMLIEAGGPAREFWQHLCSIR